jgi:hypothetical protein
MRSTRIRPRGVLRHSTEDVDAQNCCLSVLCYSPPVQQQPRHRNRKSTSKAHLFGHQSVATTGRHYAKGVKGRQDRLDALVSATGTK